MDRLILALLKLLLQLVIFLLTGHWPKIERGPKPGGRTQPAPGSARKRAQRTAPSATETRGRSRASATRSRDTRAPWPVEVEARARARERNDEVARASGVERGADVVAQAPLERRRAPAAVARPQVGAPLSPELGRRSLARLVRDPSAIRDAVVLGVALGVRKPPR